MFSRRYAPLPIKYILWKVNIKWYKTCLLIIKWYQSLVIMNWRRADDWSITGAANYTTIRWLLLASDLLSIGKPMPSMVSIRLCILTWLTGCGGLARNQIDIKVIRNQILNRFKFYYFRSCSPLLTQTKLFYSEKNPSKTLTWINSA